MKEAAGSGVRAGHRPPWRAALIAAIVLAVLIASAAITYRVLAPAEVVTEATSAYPGAAAQARPGVIGTLAAAPLIVDGRLRLYATKRQIRADAPVDARTQRSPLWSYRRWPEQLVGVVAAGTTVVGRWSDGRLVAIDARTGRVAWRADGPAPVAREYAGRRTGASTLYAPDGLATAGPVVIAWGRTEAVAVASRGGRELWRLPLAGPACRAAGFTTAAGRFAVRDGCAGQPRSLAFYDASSGRPVGHWRHPAGRDTLPLGCKVGRSECAAMRTVPDATGSAAEARAWLLRGPEPVPAPGLAGPDTRLVEAPGVGDLAVGAGDGRLVARRAGTGEQVWSWLPDTAEPPGRARVIAVQPGRVHLLTGDYWLVTVDARTGAELSRFAFTYGRERTGWTAGYAYAAAGFVLLERLEPGVEPAAADDEFYFIAQPVLLAGT